MSRELTERQKEILDYLVRMVQEQGFPPTLREMMDHFGISSTNGITRHLEALEKKGWIHRDSGARSIRLNPALLEAPAPANLRMVPLVGEVAAGRPITAVENVEDRLPISEDWLRVNDSSFFLRVRGDSMAEAIQPADLVLVEPSPTAQRNEIVVAMIEDEATVKRYLPEADRVVLRSDNPAYADIIVSRDFRLVGRVTALIRKYR